MESNKPIIFIISFLLIIATLFVFKDILTGKSISADTRLKIDPGFRVIYDEFEEGNTTNFLNLNDTDLETIVNLTIEKINFGKIQILETVNLTQDADDQGVINLDDYIDISYNNIRVDTANLTSLNKSAVLYFYSVGFVTFNILKDQEICESDCNLISSSPEVVSFSVSNLEPANYSLQEIETEEGATTSSGGGSSGGGDDIKIGLEIEPDTIHVKLKQGDTKKEKIKLTNTGNVFLNIDTDIENIDDFVILDKERIRVDPGKTETINADFFASKNEIVDIYTGRILFKTSYLEEVRNVIIEIIGKTALFDISVEDVSGKVYAGGDVKAKINLTNLGDKKPVDVLLSFGIRDYNGKIIVLQEETLAVSDGSVVEREVDLPETVGVGDYVFFSKIEYLGEVAVGSFGFSVLGEQPVIDRIQEKVKAYLYVILTILVLIIIILLLIWERDTVKLKKEERKLKGKKSLFNRIKTLIFKRKKSTNLKRKNIDKKL